MNAENYRETLEVDFWPNATKRFPDGIIEFQKVFTLHLLYQVK